MRRLRSTLSVRRLTFGVLIGGIVLAMSSTPKAVVFANLSPITIPTVGNGAPYPSSINVSGMPGTITSVSVTLNNLSHSFLDDIAIVLVGPSGALLLMDGVAETNVASATVTLQDGAAAMPDSTALITGTDTPTAYFTGDSFPAPGPGTTYNHPGPAGGNTATFASTFNGTPANGTWSLYIVDYVNGDGGSIANGWSLNITTSLSPLGPVALHFHG